MEIRSETQLSAVADEVSALTAVVRPILEGTLYSLRKEVAETLGGYDKITLFMLAATRNPGDGDCGISFEYAVHDAIARGEDSVLERVSDALTQCKVTGDAKSILFGLEKTGAQLLIETAQETLTDASVLMSGRRGKPALLKPHLRSVAAAFRSPTAREALPQSISGLWRADLFVGATEVDRWVGATVKINPKQLEGARGLRIGIVPETQGRSDAIQIDESKNLVICPIPYDEAFMETFYGGWQIVQTFLAAHAKLPKPVALPYGAHRQVARYLEERRDFPVVDVIEALATLEQPNLLAGHENVADVVPALREAKDVVTSAFITPVPLQA